MGIFAFQKNILIFRTPSVAAAMVTLSRSAIGKMALVRKTPKVPGVVKLAVWLAVCLAASSCLPETGWQQPPPPLAYPQSPPPGPGIYFLAEVEGEVGRLANEGRRQYGLPPLTGNQALAAAARRHSGDMLARGFFSHVNPDGLSACQRLPRGYDQVLKQSGENIWMGSGYNSNDSRRLAGTIMSSLMASPGHRQNILDPQYTHLGVGVAACGQEVRATQIFGQLPANLAHR
jgi:uncharacterized protein YkwD